LAITNRLERAEAILSARVKQTEIIFVDSIEQLTEAQLASKTEIYIYIEV
jgi:hypothetical protein